MKVGDYIEAHILDHANGSKSLVDCFVRGRVIEVDKTKVVLCWWGIEDEDYEGSEETVTLIRAAIAKWRRVLKWSPWKVEALSVSNQ